MLQTHLLSHICMLQPSQRQQSRADQLLHGDDGSGTHGSHVAFVPIPSATPALKERPLPPHVLEVGLLLWLLLRHHCCFRRSTWCRPRTPASCCSTTATCRMRCRTFAHHFKHDVLKVMSTSRRRQPNRRRLKSRLRRARRSAHPRNGKQLHHEIPGRELAQGRGTRQSEHDANSAGHGTCSHRCRAGAARCAISCVCVGNLIL